MHARRFAQQHIERHVDRPAAIGGFQHKIAIVADRADHRIRAAFTTTQEVEGGKRVGRNREDITLLRLVAPDFGRRQAAGLQGNRVDLEDRAPIGTVDQFGQRIGQPAGSHIVDRQNRIVFAHRAAGIEDLLGTTLHFGIATLDRIEIELGGVAARAHARGRTATQADAHARAAQLDQQRTRRQIVFADMDCINIAHAAGDHDRLVIATHRMADLLLVGAEIADQVGSAKLVVEGSAAQRAVDHDRQRRGDALRAGQKIGRGGATIDRCGHILGGLPGLLEARNAQVGHRKTGQAESRP